MRLTTTYLILFACLLFSCENTPPTSDIDLAGKDWPVYGGDLGGNQYSSLKQVNSENVKQLELAWTYKSDEIGDKNNTQIQCNPLIIDGVLYATSPKIKFFALNAATGEELWSFDPFSMISTQTGFGVNRGLHYWKEGKDVRILGTAGSFLFAIDAKTGLPVESFGDKGKVDLHLGLGEESKERFVGSNSPGVIFEDLLILGTRVSEGKGAAPGYIRAYEVKTGKIKWIFHTIPREGEFGADTWPEGKLDQMGGANSWAGMSLDKKRGMVFIPTGSASFDFYGGDRPGDNLFANCILALNARTGERIWHYQTVKHDLWDRDLPAAPNLISLNIEGKKVDAVAQISKAAWVYVLDRETGEPLFPIEEKSVPASDLPGEYTAATQPFPTLPPPFSRQELTEDGLTDIGEENHAFALQRFKQVRSKGQFEPPSQEGTVIFPGFDGGGEWGGASVDPSGIMYINASEMAWILTMVPLFEEEEGNILIKGKNLYMRSCATCHSSDLSGGAFMGTIPSLVGVKNRLSGKDILSVMENGKGNMPAFSFIKEENREAIKEFLLAYDPDKEAKETVGTEPTYFASTGYHRFFDQEGYPAVKPPWGTLNAIDLNKGEILWQKTLGELPELTARGIPPTGTENYGGPVSTAGNLIFIAASKDEKFHAFDKTSGEVLWEVVLPAGGYATPSIYMVEGKQFIVIAAGGGKMGTDSGDSYLAFSLPD